MLFVSPSWLIRRFRRLQGVNNVLNDVCVNLKLHRWFLVGWILVGVL